MPPLSAAPLFGIGTVDARNLALAAAATSAAAVAGAAVYRAVASGRKTTRSAPAHFQPSEQQALDAAVADILARKGEIAQTLSSAIQLKTISFEYPDGRNASLLGLDDHGQPAGATPGAAVSSAFSAAGEPVRQRKAGGGCACNCHGVRAALGDESGTSASAGTAATTDDATSSPSPAALALSKASFLQAHTLLAQRFPLVHAAGGPVTRHVVNECSLVYIWKGRVESDGQGQGQGQGQVLRPGIALAGHLDVVPVPDAGQWTHPPFAGRIAPDPATGQECVWGRGAIDDKHSVVAILSAVEALLKAGYAPSVPYMAILVGHDEELGGPDGAAVMAQQLPALIQASLGPSYRVPTPAFSFLLDEGLFLLSDFVPAHAGPVAVVCVGEKGHVNVEVSVEAPAGHSSVPGPTTTIGILSKAITRIEARPFPLHMYPASDLLAALLPGLPFAHRLLLGNLWLTAPLVSRVMARTPASAAMLRTTTAVTLIGGGLKSNVIPPRASAVVNHRIHPAESVASVVARDAHSVADARVKLRPFEELEPAPVSSSSPSAPGWASVSSSLSRVFGEGVTPAPGLMLGNTDTRHYWGLAQDIYRHCPTELSMAGTAMFHGKDERINVDNLARIAAFYASVIVEGCARTAAAAAGSKA